MPFTFEKLFVYQKIGRLRRSRLRAHQHVSARQRISYRSAQASGPVDRDQPDRRKRPLHTSRSPQLLWHRARLRPGVRAATFFGLEGRPFIARGEPRFVAEPRVHGRPLFGGRARDAYAHRRSTSPQHPEPNFGDQGKAEVHISTIEGHELSIHEHDAQVRIQ